jgi:transposase-like protein
MAAEAAPPDPEVVARPVKRTFTAAYKQQILREADQCKKLGELGALLRREGLYRSILQKWRAQREMAEQDALRPKKAGRKAKQVDPAVRGVVSWTTTCRFDSGALVLAVIVIPIPCADRDHAARGL